MRFQLKVLISGINDHRELEQVVQENQQEWSAAIQLFVRRHFEYMRQESNAITLNLNTPISSFPFSIHEGADGLWYGNDLSDFIQIVPIGVEPGPERDSLILQRDDDAEVSVDVCFLANPAEEASESSATSVQTDASESSAWDQNFQQHSGLVAALMALSCLIQYTVELNGIQSYAILRKFIIPEIIQRVHRGDYEHLPRRGNPACEWKSFVEFDRGALQNCLEEWLSVGGNEADGSNSMYKTGRAAGLILTGSKGVGKTMFCRDLIRCLEEIAPWMVTVMYQTSPSEQTPAKFFHGTYFVDEFTTNDDLIVRGHQPLVIGPYCVNEASPIGVQKMANVFEQFKASAKPGKIVVTLVDDWDILTRSVQAHSIITQFRAEMGKADFEFFVFGTSSDPSLPSFDSIDSSKNQFRMNSFRTMKIYSMPLQRAFDFILCHVKRPPAIAYPKTTIMKLRNCARALLDEKAKELRDSFCLRLHNMKVPDLKKISLHLCIDLAKRVSMSDVPVTLDGETAEVYQDIMMESLQRVFNCCETISGLSPPVIAAFPWIRHDIHYQSAIEDIVDSIYVKCKRDRQFIHFVRLEVPEMENNTNRYNHPAIPMRSIPSLLHHLHGRYRFRSSYILESPEQLLPYHPQLSADVPYSSANPFDEFYWQSRNSCLIINTMESVIGYHEELERGYATMEEKEILSGQLRGTGFAVNQHLGGSIALNGGKMVGTANANANTEAHATGKKTKIGGDVGVQLSLDAIHGDGSVGKSWSTDRAMANQVSRALTDAVPLGADAFVNYGKLTERTATKGVSECRAEANVTDHSSHFGRIFEHPEAMTRLVVGLKSLSEMGSRYVEDLNNVVLVFYAKDGCFDEIALKRLGWGKNGEYETPSLGCRHFKRNVRIKTPCCHKWYHCEHCHDEKENHQLDLRSVEEIQCLICYTQQSIQDADGSYERGRECMNVNCRRALAALCCPTCRIWREAFDNGNLIHCNSCQRCFSSNYYPIHADMCQQRMAS